VLSEAYQWLLESTSALIEHEAYPELNTEHRWDDVFDLAHTSLHELEAGGHSLWTLLEHLKRNDSLAVGGIWSAIESSVSAIAALNLTVNLGVEFPNFSLELWNKPPHDFFSSVLGFPDSVSSLLGQGIASGLFTPIDLDGGSSSSVSAALTHIDDFSAQHYHVKVTDPEVKSASLGNLLQGTIGTALKGLVKIEGLDWQVLDMSDLASKTYCFENAGEKLEEAVLVFSHFDSANLQPVQFQDKALVSAHDTCGWHGTASLEARWDGGFKTHTFTAEARDLFFVPSDESVDGGELFDITRGEVTWTFISTCYRQSFCPDYVVGCAQTGVATGTLSKGDGQLLVRPNGQGLSYEIFGAIVTNPPPTIWTEKCGEALGDQNVGAEWICAPDQTSPRADLLEGTHSTQGTYFPSQPGSCPIQGVGLSGVQAGTTDYTWRFER
jgi:hypothetical protein